MDKRALSRLLSAPPPPNNGHNTTLPYLIAFMVALGIAFVVVIVMNVRKRK